MGTIDNSILTKETFLQIKKDQIDVMLEARTKFSSKKYQEELNAWYAKKPEKDLILWRNSRPNTPWILCLDSRSLNIVYGMLRGHAYRAIEQKCRENNKPNKEQIRSILEHYNIDFSLFLNTYGEIDYE